jgi:autotransporter-associated beta strand protein
MEAWVATFKTANMAVLLAGSLCAGCFAEEVPKADPAAHTVIVPYDGKAPDAAAGAKRYYLDYAEFQRLWDLAKENRRPALAEQEGVKAEAVINSALYDAEIEDERLVLNARLSVVTRGGSWVRLPLGFKAEGLSISDVKLDGHTAVLGDDGLLVEKPGAHTVEVTVAVLKSRGWQDVNVELPRAAASLLAVTVPDRDGKPTLSRSSVIGTESVKQGHRVFTYALGNNADFKLSRQPFRKLGDGAPPASADTEEIISLLPGVEKVEAEVKFVFAGSQRSRFTVRMDGTLKPVSWGIPGLREWSLRQEGSEQLADIVLNEVVADQFRVRLTAERVVQTSTGQRSAPLVSGEAGRKMVEVHLRHSPDLLVTASGGAQRVESSLKAAADVLNAGAYRLSGGEKLSYAIAPAEDRSSAHVDEVYQVSAQKAEIIALIVMNTGRLPLQEARIGVPAGFEVQTLTGPRVLSWHREADQLIIHLDNNPVPAARLVVHVAKTLTQPSPTWALEPLKLPQFKKQDSKVLIAVHAADDVKLTFDGAKRDLREFDPATLESPLNVAPPLAVKRALIVDAASWQASVTLTRQVPKFAVDAVLLAQATDEGLKLSQQTGIIVEQGMLNSVKLRVPKELPEARVVGPLVRDARSSINGDLRLYEVTFQSDVLERADFTMEFELPIDGQKTLPVIFVDGAARSRRFFIVDNASSREMKTDAGAAEKVVKESLPYIPDGVVRPEFYRVSDDASLKLAFSQLESSAGNAAIVTLAEITSALRTNGERWDSVVYSLANRSLQFLPVKLPHGAELIEVSFGGQTVRADTADAGAEPKTGRTYLVPLIQMRPGELSQQVKLVYRLKAGRERDSLDDPELVGLSVERTLWNVWVPEHHELARWDGNMEEVTEEVREYEKKHELLGDLARMNRVMASKDVKVSDWQMACNNANMIMSKLKEVKPVLRGSVYDRSEKKPAKQADAEKQGVQLQQAQADVAKQVEEQGKLLLSNSGAVQLGMGQSRTKAVDLNEPQIMKQGAGTWNSQTTGQMAVVNGNSQFFNNGTSKVSMENNLALNDNIVVAQDALSQQLDSAPAAGQKAAQAVAVVNAGATVNIQQTAGNNAIASNARANTYTGATTINAGTLSNSTVAALAGNIQVGNGAGQAGGGVVFENLSGSTALTKSGGGTLTLSANNTFAGDITVNGGSLTVGGVGMTSGNRTNLGTGGLIQNSVTSASALRDQGAAGVVLGANSAGSALTITGGNTYTGGTTLTGGSLAISGSGGVQMPGIQADGGTAIEQATRGLQAASNYERTGDYDNAFREFQSVLRADQNNQAARTGLERVEQRKKEYFDTARDHQRTRMLNQVTEGWEEKIPATATSIAEREIARRGQTAIAGAGPFGGAAAGDPFAAAAPATPVPKAIPVMEPEAAKRNLTVNSVITPLPAKPRSTAMGAVPTPNAPVVGRLFGSNDEMPFADAATTPQLKPVGRVSLAVEVPLEGTVHHFRKLKDHAKLDLKIDKPMDARQSGALWTLVVGIVLLMLISAAKKIRLRRPALA